MIMYPVYTNFIAGSRESTVLSAWEDQKEEFFEELEAEEEDPGYSGCRTIKSGSNNEE